MISNSPLIYQNTGIKIDTGHALDERIKPLVNATRRPEILGNFGGFSTLCTIPQKYHEPILVSSADAVGAKLSLAIALQKYDTIGIDLVAMCVNDLIVQGAEPLFFLDYYATGKLNLDIATDVIHGITQACRQAGCALIGGETSEMPGVYHATSFDLAGFCVGVVEKNVLIDGSKVKNGDSLIAIASTGPHASGYELIRQILDDSQADPQTTMLQGKSIAEHLLAPTPIYVKAIRSLIAQIEVHAIAHITEGGFEQNLPRMLPDNTQAIIHERSWQWPVIFDWLQQNGKLSREAMYHHFNCGVGMIIAVPTALAEQAIDIVHAAGESAWKIGEIHTSNSTEQVVIRPKPIQ